MVQKKHNYNQHKQKWTNASDKAFQMKIMQYNFK